MLFVPSYLIYTNFYFSHYRSIFRSHSSLLSNNSPIIIESPTYDNASPISSPINSPIPLYNSSLSPQEPPQTSTQSTLNNTNLPQPKSRYTFTNRIRKTFHIHGKKNSKNIIDEKLQTAYLSQCCAKHHIINNFPLQTFISKRQSYIALQSEREKSKFIDRLLDSAIRTDSEGFIR